MPDSSSVTQSIAGTQAGRKTIVTPSSTQRLHVTRIYWKASNLRSRKSDAVCTITIQAGFTDWVEGHSNIQYEPIGTFTVKAATTANSWSSAIVNFYGPAGYTFYGRFKANNGIASGSTAGAAGDVIFYITYELENRPTVSVGTVITSAQITNLTNWKNYSLAGSSLQPGRNSKLDLMTNYSVGRVIYNNDVGARSGYTAISAKPGPGVVLDDAWYNSR